jgi:hypothetical protein
MYLANTMTSRIVPLHFPVIGGQPVWGEQLIKQLSERGIENLTLMVLLDALGVAGLSLEQSEEASKTFLKLSAYNEAHPEEKIL